MIWFIEYIPQSENYNVIKFSDRKCYVPKDETNSDYQEYLAWIAQGNEPEVI